MNQSSEPKSDMAAGKKNKFLIFTVVFAVFIAVYLFMQTQTSEDHGTEDDTSPVPDFSQYTNVVEKKKAFFNYLMPEIKRQNELVLKEREFVRSLQAKLSHGDSLTRSETKQLTQLNSKYKVTEDADTSEQVSELLVKVDVIPPALVLVQAANESAWGTSRFAQKGYNFFGLWCFKKGCGFVPRQRNDEAVHEVGKFRNLSHAVHTYIRNLNRHYAYDDLREIRKNLRDNDEKITAEALAQGLSSYSERGQEYIDELLSMISHNRKYMSI